jgi:hypothetical protein
VAQWRPDVAPGPPLWPVIETNDGSVRLDRSGRRGLRERVAQHVPGSHRWGDAQAFLETVPDYESLPATHEGHQVEVVPCPVKKGEVGFHHALT